MQSQLAFATAPPPAAAITLRPYQREAIDTMLQEYEGGVTRQLVVAPTGTGKTITLSSLIKERDQRALILVHRDELVRQTIQKVGLVAPHLSVGVVQASQNDYGADCVVATVQTAHRDNRLRNLAGFGTVVVDEAHHSVAGTYQKIIERTVEAGTLLGGFTATPERTDGSGLGDTFDKVVWQMELMDAIAQGYLVDIKAVRVGIGVDLDGVRQSSKKGGRDFVDQDLADAMEDADSPATIAAAVIEHASQRKSVIFCPTVKVARMVMDELNTRGHPTGIVIGETPSEERQRIYREIENGALKALVGVAVFTEGWDLPAIDCVVMARPTKSRPLYVQCAGRGLRLSPGKKDCLLIDCVGVTGMKLMSVADMTGVAEEDVTEGGMSVLEAAEAQAEREDEELEREGKRRKMIAKAVDVFHRESMAWVPSDTMHVLPVGDKGVIAVAMKDDGAWDVIKVRSRPKAIKTPRGWRKPPDNIKERVEVVASGLDPEMAQGMAEGIARQHMSRALVDPKAEWREQPAGEAQQRVLGKAFQPGMSKGEASDAITMKFTKADISKAQREGVL